ncbi:type VI secretion protein, partial [Streptomyces hainanensis]
MSDNAAGRRGGGIPDGLLLAALGLALAFTTLVWSATGLGGLLRHGAWPDGVSFLRTAGAVRTLLVAPRDVAGAWPGADPSTLPSAGVLWLTFLGQLVVLFCAALWVSVRVAHHRARRRTRVRDRAPDRHAPEPKAAAPGPFPGPLQAPASEPATPAVET